jgi:hypothetical protein
MRHISVQDSVFADALSRIESVTAPPSHDALAAAQNSDELRTILAANVALRLEKQPMPGTTASMYCETSAGKLGRTFQLSCISKCSSPSTIGGTQAPKQEQSKDLFVWLLQSLHTNTGQHPQAFR